MKVLFVNLPSQRLFKPVVPLGLIYLSACLDRHGYENEVLDLNYSLSAQEGLVNRIGEYHPDIVGISVRNIAENSAMNSCYEEIRKYVTLAKQKAPVILGGAGFSLFSEQLLKLTHADYGIRGEGETALLQILRGLKPDQEALFRTEEGYPFISSDISGAYLRYWDRYGRYLVINRADIPIQRIRGCSGGCLYCSYPQLCNHRVYYRRIEKVVDEIETILHHTNYPHIYFVDSVFNMNRDYSKEFLRCIKRRGLKINWKCCINPEDYDRELISLMKDNGCVSCEVGLDSLSDEVLKKLNKGYDKEKTVGLLKLLEEVKIPYSISLILGGYGERKETLADTLHTLEAYHPEAVQGFIGTRIYPNTPLQARLGKAADDLLYGDACSYYITSTVTETIREFILSKPGSWTFAGADLKGKL